jgi:protein involved in polysaccharide export with SLBB domain
MTGLPDHSLDTPEVSTMRRKSARYGLALVASCAMLLLAASALRARQETPKPAPSPFDAGQREAEKKAEEKREAERKKVTEALDKMLEAYDLKPHPLPAIPDDPPPVEGAMINYPLVIQPPDLLLVEVLEALPGRPVSGERLVRHDGTISLGFYGDVHVAGLTLPQAKVKIIKHLRTFLSDDVLGLIDTSEAEAPAGGPPPPTPVVPKQQVPEKKEEPKQARESGDRLRVVPTAQGSRSIRSAAASSRSAAKVRLAGRAEAQEPKQDEAAKQVKIPLDAGGQVKITIEVQAGNQEPEAVAPAESDVGPGQPIPAERSERVFVDVTAYNSANYYVQGDVTAPGRLPFTGSETVLDALQFAGGLIQTAEPRDIRLVRPARGDKPAKVFKVDLEAIRDRGDVTSNYQIFPGDRLVVGRNDVVKKTIEIDRLSAPLQTAISSMMQESFLLRSLKTNNPENHEAILKDLVEFWIQEMKRPEAKLDEQTLRDALIKRLQIKP